jgi:peptidyl-prolyl cis-trans isomerase SDCCAG10
MSNIYHLEPPTKGKVVLHTTYGDVDVELWAREVCGWVSQGRAGREQRLALGMGVCLFGWTLGMGFCVLGSAASRGGGGGVGGGGGNVGWTDGRMNARTHGGRANQPFPIPPQHPRTPQTPIACRNFVQLALEGYYDGTLFHRVVPNFMVQGGDPTGTCVHICIFGIYVYII